MNILLMGNPNVGKSVIFSRLTGTRVTASNYPGTTVEYTEGLMRYRSEEYKIIDVPGTYTLNPTNRAEEVAVEMVEKGDLVINVVDSTNLERNLNLTLQLLEKDIPVIIALNFWDEAQHQGIDIDVEKLKQELEVPVVPTVAIEGKGIREILNNINEVENIAKDFGDTEARWAEIGNIIEKVQKITPRGHTWKERLEELSIKPLSGIPILAIVLYISFTVVRFIGEGLIGYVTEPFFEYIYKPLLFQFSKLIGNEFLHDLFIGELISGEIDLEQSFGLLSTGIFIPFGAVLPYIISFYLILGIMEDTGYLPRIAVLLDNVTHKVGLHGFSVIPMILGLGCNVPGALATRSLDSPREKFIASTLMAISVPCMAQIAMILGLLGPFGGEYILYVFFMLAVVWITVGIILNKLLPGFSNDLLLEVPPLRMPGKITVIKKLWMRGTSFLREAIPYMLIGVFVVNLLYTLGVFEALTGVLGPVFNSIFGLPREAVSALLMGFLRKDLAMGLLVPLDLTAKQLVVASTVLAVYFPCVATFMVLIRELGIKDMIKSAAVMILAALTVGGFINYTFHGSPFSLTSVLIIILLLILLRYLPNLNQDKEQMQV